MKKSDRDIVFNKYGGKCAYCGCELQKGWHVDHIESIGRKTKTKHSHYKHKETKEELPLANFLINHKHLTDDQRDKWEYIQRKEIPDGCDNPELDIIENMNPACASCNIQKHGYNIESFRSDIAYFITTLNKSSNQYKFAKRYGLVQEIMTPVVFYFEKLKAKGDGK